MVDKCPQKRYFSVINSCASDSSAQLCPQGGRPSQVLRRLQGLTEQNVSKLLWCALWWFVTRCRKGVLPCHMRWVLQGGNRGHPTCSHHSKYNFPTITYLVADHVLQRSPSVDFTNTNYCSWPSFETIQTMVGARSLTFSKHGRGPSLVPANYSVQPFLMRLWLHNIIRYYGYIP